MTPKIKLSPNQEAILRYFADPAGKSGSGRGFERTYDALRRKGLIEPIDVFPFHAATTAGQAWIIAQDQRRAGAPEMTAAELVTRLIRLHLDHPDFSEVHPRAVGRKELLIDAITLVHQESHNAAVARLERATEAWLAERR